MPVDSLIARVLKAYFPGWEPPPDNKEWNPMLCPEHGEERPSAAISYRLDAVKCQACDFKGTVVGIIMRKEGIAYGAALTRAAEISGGSYEPVSRKSVRKSRRRAFGEPGTDGGERGGGRRTFSSRVRE